METSLRTVCAQFPLLGDRVADLFERDMSFRELCEDYQACADAIARHPAAEPMLREYRALLLRLETELLTFLSDAEKQGQ